MHLVDKQCESGGAGTLFFMVSWLENVEKPLMFSPRVSEVICRPLGESDPTG